MAENQEPKLFKQKRTDEKTVYSKKCRMYKLGVYRNHEKEKRFYGNNSSIVL